MWICVLTVLLYSAALSFQILHEFSQVKYRGSGSSYIKYSGNKI